MADINMEKKQGGSMTWLWVLIAIVILALVAWWLMREPTYVDPVGTTTAPVTMTEVVAPSRVPVSAVTAGTPIPLDS